MRRLQVCNSLTLRDINAAALPLVLQGLLSVHRVKQWVLTLTHVSKIDVIVVICLLPDSLVLLSESHDIRVHLVWSALGQEVALL